MTIAKNQLELEKQNLQIMVDGATNRLEKARQDKSLADNKLSRNVIPHYVNELNNKLKMYLFESLQGNARVKPVPVRVLTLLPTEIVAHFTVKTVVNHLGGKQVSLSTLVNLTAKQLEIEFNLLNVKKSDKKHHDRFVSWLQRTGYKGNRLNKITGDILSKYYKDLIRDDLMSSMIQLSHLCIHLLSESMPIVNNQISPVLFHMGNINVKEYHNLKSKVVIYPSPWFMAWLRQQTLDGNMVSNYHTPLIEVPKDWTSLETGGFHTKRFKNKMIKTDIGVEHYDFSSMERTVRAINTLQKTPWEINKELLEVMQYVFVNKLNWGGFPSPQEVLLSEYPFPDVQRKDMSPEQLEVAKAWSSHHARLYSEYASEVSKYMMVNRALNEAKRFKVYPKIYFAYQADFRGRLYPISSNLHPQASEFVKSLIRFHEGKVIDTPEAYNFFCGHGANLFGNDKITLIEKVQFIESIEKEIIKTANNPYDNQHWLQADEPWGFLAFCFEYAEYKKNPKGFLSKLPIALDGSCNGLQHLSAMLLDEVGGRSTNLTNNLNKADIYSDVRDVVIGKLKHRNTALTASILEFGVERSTTKRPVMIVPYAGTLNACRKYIQDDFDSRGGILKFGSNYQEVLTLVSELVWEAIGEVVIKGREVMEWFKDSAKEVCKIKTGSNNTINWTTPNGFQVIQKRVIQNERLLQTSLGELVRLSFTYKVDTEYTDSRGHATSISPNFIHSLDACCLQETVNKLADEGLGNFAMIHDSYGTHAADTPKMAKALREVFFDIYSKNNVLDNWINEQAESVRVKFKDLPTKGNLDLREVLLSEHFFA